MSGQFFVSFRVFRGLNCFFRVELSAVAADAVCLAAAGTGGN